MMLANGGHIGLTLGPQLFNWPAATLVDFYARIADEAPVDTVCVGEVVCSKRSPFHAAAIAEACERLRRAGKKVVLSSLALITLKRERHECVALMAGEDYPVEINDLTALFHLRDGRPFSVGPFVNLYNESTLDYLVGRGANHLCFPPELPLAAVQTLSSRANALGASPEIWSFGRIPLAISGRCYHARLRGLNKDSCQFVCENDPDGMEIRTLDEQALLAVNGVQTLSDAYCSLIGDTEILERAGLGSLRLSPHSCDMVAVARIFRDVLDRRIDDVEGRAQLAAICGRAVFANGFLLGSAGVEMAKNH